MILAIVMEDTERAIRARWAEANQEGGLLALCLQRAIEAANSMTASIGTARVSV